MNKSTLSVLFFIKKNEPKKNGLSTIMIRLTIDGKQIQFSSKLEVKPHLWDQKSNKVKGKNATAQKINSLLDSMRLEIYTHYVDLQRIGFPVTPEKVKEVFLGYKSEAMLGYLLNDFIKHLKKRRQINLSEKTFQKYQIMVDRLHKFTSDEYNRTDIHLNDITERFIESFYLYIRKKYDCEHNTTMKYIQRFSSVMGYAERNGLVAVNPFRYYIITFKPSEPVCLAEKEIRAIYEKKFMSKRISMIRDIFIFSCYTGIAFIDICNLKKSDVQTGFDNELWLKINRQKTDIPSHIPLLEIPKEIYKSYSKISRDEKLFSLSSNQKTNEYLKEIADICGIKKNLTFHVVRHSFATLMLNYGVSIESLSRMMGHRNIKTTQLYARVTDRKVKEELACSVRNALKHW